MAENTSMVSLPYSTTEMYISPLCFIAKSRNLTTTRYILWKIIHNKKYRMYKMVIIL